MPQPEVWSKHQPPVTLPANAPSRAKSFFNEIKSSGNGSEFLSRLIDRETPAYESEFLDFKGGRMADKAELKKLQKEWAKCLSCFANSDGGVILFGFHAPNNKPESLQLVEDMDGLVQNLNNWLPRFTEPPVQRVEIERFAYPVGSSAGFVVCFIPSSPWRPHQTKSSEDPDHFYIRAADNCIPCSTRRLGLCLPLSMFLDLRFTTCASGKISTPMN